MCLCLPSRRSLPIPLRSKDEDILRFHQFRQAANGPETRIEAQECGHSLIQYSDPKDHSTVIVAIDDAIAVDPGCGRAVRDKLIPSLVRQTSKNVEYPRFVSKTSWQVT